MDMIISFSKICITQIDSVVLTLHKKRPMEMIIHSIEELDNVVEALLKYAGDCKTLLFYGEIGAGKTTLIQRFCKHFEVAESVTSPTFSLINEYSFKNKTVQSEQLIYHLDLYRLKNINEAIDIGIEDYLFGNYYCLIEWPEIIEPLLPEHVVKIKIHLLDNSSRKIIFL
jgi:tRNA threonylcarbamoyladenosine biosynthesis protein TsaE